ncbi:MAG: nucleotide pyrophosphohydrolase [Candidatus Nanopelagicaceae bacterium]
MTKNSDLDFDSLTESLRDFARGRDWEKFHSPKNLAMAVAGETGELVAEFQWLSSEESHRSSLSEDKMQSIAMEIADVQIYLLRLADVLGVDIPTAVKQKMRINEERF